MQMARAYRWGLRLTARAGSVAGLPRDEVIFNQQFYEDVLDHAHLLELTLMVIPVRPLRFSSMRDAFLDRVDIGLRQVGFLNLDRCCLGDEMQGLSKMVFPPQTTLTSAENPRPLPQTLGFEALGLKQEAAWSCRPLTAAWMLFWYSEGLSFRGTQEKWLAESSASRMECTSQQGGTGCFACHL
jgi:hypothetical protein